MQISKWKKISLGIAGTVLLGALGSGCWEIAVKPFGIWLGKLILTAATLGSSSIKDSIYREAAKGVHEASSLHLLFLIVLAITAATIGPLAFLAGRWQGSRQANRFFNKIEDLDVLEQRTAVQTQLDKTKKRFYGVTVAMLAVAFIYATAEFINYLELEQANMAYTFFEQSIQICKPYLSDKDERMLESRFAGINQRADFIGIIDELKRIASENQRKLPDFNPW